MINKNYPIEQGKEILVGLSSSDELLMKEFGITWNDSFFKVSEAIKKKYNCYYGGLVKEIYDRLGYNAVMFWTVNREHLKVCRILYKGEDGNNHVYTPIRGNCVNPDTKEELRMADIEFIMNELSSLDKISTVACIKAENILEPDWDLCLTEFLAYERYC